jgi:hypothetical protein
MEDKPSTPKHGRCAQSAICWGTVQHIFIRQNPTTTLSTLQQAYLGCKPDQRLNIAVGDRGMYLHRHVQAKHHLVCQQAIARTKADVCKNVAPAGLCLCSTTMYLTAAPMLPR